MPWIIIIAAVLMLGLIVFPFVNKLQFKKLPPEQQVRILMKQAKGLDWFKNISDGSEGRLIYVKNKRKIYIYPWKLVGGRMVCNRSPLFEKWDYPEENPQFYPEEKIQALEALDAYNEKSIVKIYLNESE